MPDVSGDSGPLGSLRGRHIIDWGLHRDFSLRYWTTVEGLVSICSYKYNSY